MATVILFVCAAATSTGHTVSEVRMHLVNSDSDGFVSQVDSEDKDNKDDNDVERIVLLGDVLLR